MSTPQKAISIFDSFGQQIQFQATDVFRLPVLAAAEGIPGADSPSRLMLVGGTINTGAGTSKSLTLTTDGALITVDEFAEAAQNTLTFSASTGATSVTINAGRPVLSIQGKSSAATTVFLLRHLQAIGNGAKMFYQLVLNGTLTGASFTSVNSASGINFDTSATVISGGTIVDQGFVTFGSKDLFYQLHFGVTEGVCDILSVVLTPMGIYSVPASASMRWTEDVSL